MKTYYRAFEVLGSKDPSVTCALRLLRLERARRTDASTNHSWGRCLSIRIIKWSLFSQSVCASNKNSAGLIRPASNTIICHACGKKNREKSRRSPLAWNPAGIKIDQNPSSICWGLWWIFQRVELWGKRESAKTRGPSIIEQPDSIENSFFSISIVQPRH